MTSNFTKRPLYTKPKGPPVIVSLVYSSKTDSVTPYYHRNGSKRPNIDARWLKRNLGGQRYWDIAIMVEYADSQGITQIARADVANTRKKGNTCTHEDLRECLVVEHAELIRDVEKEGHTADHLYWIATPNAPNIENNEVLKILEEVENYERV